MTTRLAPERDDDLEGADLDLTDEQVAELAGEDDEDDPLFTDDGEGEEAESEDGADEPDGDEEQPEDEDQREGTADTEDSPAEGEAADAASTDRPAPESGAPASDAAAKAPEPWHFTADGQRVDVPDSAVVDVGGKRAVVIALDAWQRHVQPHLRHQSYWQKREQEYRARDPERHPDVIAAKTMTAKLRELLEDESGEKLHEFAADLQRNRELLERDVKIAQLEATRTAQETDARTEREAEEGARLEQQMQGALKSTLVEMAKSEFPGLDTEKAHAALWTVADRIFGIADRDYPEYGLAKGQVAIKYDAIRALLAPYAGQKKDQRADGKGDAASEVERRNKTRLARGRRPAPAARAASTAAPGGKEKRPSNRDEWEASAMSELASIINDAD